MKNIIGKIEHDYDPNNDIGSPQVTYTDILMLELIKDLYEQVNNLKSQLAKSPQGRKDRRR